MKKILSIFLIVSAIFLFQSHIEFENSSNNFFNTSQIGCDASACLEETCRSFIARCRKGSIHSEFPGQFYDVQIKIVKNGKTDEHKKAWKLLNDGRFKKN